MFGLRRKEWKHAYKTQISYLKELALIGCLLSLVMGSLAFVAGMEEQEAVTAAISEEPPRSAAFIVRAPVPTTPKVQPEKKNSAMEDSSLDGIDPLQNPEVFDRYDVMDKLGALLAHVPSGVPTQRRDAAKQPLSVVVDKAAHRLTVFRGDKKLREFGVAVGKNPGDKGRAGDMRTPEGSFQVEQIHNASYWVHDFGDGNGVIEGAYGPLFIRLHTPPWKGIGIHGTHDPDSIGSNATEGCVRMKNEELIEFAGLIDIGTTVTILPN